MKEGRIITEELFQELMQDVTHQSGRRIASQSAEESKAVQKEEALANKATQTREDRELELL